MGSKGKKKKKKKKKSGLGRVLTRLTLNEIDIQSSNTITSN